MHFPYSFTFAQAMFGLEYYSPCTCWLSHKSANCFIGLHLTMVLAAISSPSPSSFPIAVSFECRVAKQNRHGCHQEEDASDESRQGRSSGARSRLRAGGTRCQHPRREGESTTHFPKPQCTEQNKSLLSTLIYLPKLPTPYDKLMNQKHLILWMKKLYI